MLPGLGQRLEGIGDRRGSGGHGQCRRTAFQRGDPPLKDILCGISEPSIDVPRIPKAKTVRRMLGITEHIGCGRVDRDRSGVRSRVCLLLSDM